jgi:hypothetical protein
MAAVERHPIEEMVQRDERGRRLIAAPQIHRRHAAA